MSEEHLLEREPTLSASEREPKKGRRLQTGISTLIVLVASCAVIFWAARSVWESQHPAYAAARGLQARGASERVNATRLLVNSGVGETAIAIPPLIAALNDPEAEVRVAACEALRPLVFEALRAGSDADLARTAIAALIRSLTDPQPEVRVAASTVLEYISSLKGSAGLINLDGVFAALSEMLGDREARIRIAALDALGSTGMLPNVPPAALAANLADESAGVRAAAIKALACFKSDLDPWIPKIFEVLERENDSRIRDTSIGALFQLRPPTFTAASLPALVKGLGSRYREPRLCASRLLGMLGHDAAAAIPDLIKIMADPIDSTMVGPGKLHPGGWDPAWAAAQSLGKIAPGTPSADEVIQALTEVVRAGHPYRKVAAANALSDFGPAAVGAVPSLIDDVRKNAATKADFADGADAATALGRIAPGTAVADEAVSCLNEALQAESEFTRRQAIDALLRFGSKAAVGISRFRALVNDPHAFVRAAAAKALSELGAIE
jgi:HEAT repeat protein